MRTCARNFCGLGLALAVLSACGEPSTRETLTNAELERRGLGDDFRGTDGSTVSELFVGTDRTGTGQNLRVNKFIWRGALDTLSFLPLASSDPFSGVIVTDWGTVTDVEATDVEASERFKVTVYIANERLTADTLRVAVFREVRGNEGWISAPVQADVPRQIEDSILTRARQLRIAEREAQS
ncbi:MAG: DUF3576 domain-containing protein [Pseudomonadota bacterium]